MKKALILIFSGCFIAQNLCAQENQQPSWFQRLKNKVAALFGPRKHEEAAVLEEETKNVDLKKNFMTLQMDFANKFQQVTGKKERLKSGDPIKNEEYITVALKILNILYNHSKKLQGITKDQFPIMSISFTDKDASHKLIGIWKSKPKQVIQSIDEKLLAFLIMASNDFDETQLKEVSDQINNIHIANPVQPQLDPLEKNFDVVRDAILDKLGMSLEDMNQLIRSNNGVKDGKFVITSAKALRVIYNHLPEKAQEELLDAVEKNTPSSAEQTIQLFIAAEYTASIFKIPHSSYETSGMLAEAWKNEPARVIKFILNAIPHFIAKLVVAKDQKAIDAAIQEIKSI